MLRKILIIGAVFVAISIIFFFVPVRAHVVQVQCIASSLLPGGLCPPERHIDTLYRMVKEHQQEKKMMIKREEGRTAGKKQTWLMVKNDLFSQGDTVVLDVIAKDGKFRQTYHMEDDHIVIILNPSEYLIAGYRDGREEKVITFTTDDSITASAKVIHMQFDF